LDSQTDPNSVDSDGDSVGDCVEINDAQTDPNNADSDGDGCNDGEEYSAYNTDPNNTDSDGDGVSDCDEVKEYGTNPNNPDTDGDGFNDGEEVELETSPTTGQEYPKGKYVGGADAACSSAGQEPSGMLAIFAGLLGMLGFRRRKQ
jgi:uncharacterized protein (TIGR03382 family)